MDVKKFNKLINKIKTPTAFTLLYKYYYPKIVSHTYFKFKNKSLGEDVAQEFFTKLLHKEITYIIEHPTTWVYVACDNIAKDFFTDENKYNLAYTNEGSTSSDSLFENMLYGEYAKQLEEFDEDTRKIIKYHYYEGYSLKEISDMLNINYNTVRQKCSRGLKKFKKLQ